MRIISIPAFRWGPPATCRCYPSVLADARWTVLQPMLPSVNPGGLPRQHNLRGVMDASPYLQWVGIAWRAAP